MNVSAYGGDVVLVTITAPGKDALPWDGETVSRSAADEWNASAPGRWTSLHRAASQRARRKHGRFALVAETWEYQRRGVLHRHVILGVATAAELAAAHTYVQALDDLRESRGFGFVDRGKKRRGHRSLEVVPAERAARYVAKYLSPLDAAGKPTVSDTVRRSDVPRQVVYVAHRLTAITGITMRYLRRVRLAYVLGFDPDTGELVDSAVFNEIRALVLAGVPARALGP